MYDYRRGGGVFGAFLLGGLIGAVLGLLFSPRSGKENRDVLSDAAQKYWGEGMELYETGRESATVKTAEMRDKIDTARVRLKEQVDTASEATKTKIAETVPAAKGAVSKAAGATKSGVEVAEKKAQDTLDFVNEKAAKKDKGDVVSEGDAPAAVPEV